MKIINEIINPSTGLIDLILNRIGLGSAVSTLGITTAAEAGLIELTGAWSWPGLALIVSMTGGLLFIVKLYHDIKKSRLETRLILIKINAEERSENDS